MKTEGGGQTQNLPSVFLRRATLLYLGVPVALFLAGWFRAPLAAFCLGLLGWGIWRLGWNEGWRSPARLRGPGFRAWLLGGLLPCVAFVMMSGAGGWGSGDSDWFKHDTILRDLIERPWPVVYRTSAGPVLLVYYVSFYLPAALVGKLTGSPFLAGQALAFTMLVGMLLTLGWLWALGGGGRRGGRWRAVGMFFLFSGLDVVGKGLVNLRLGLPADYGDWSDVGWWAQVFQYPSNPAALFWAPHQALGAWLPAALVLEPCFGSTENSSEPGGAWMLPLGLSAMWSPFATLGLLPLAVGMLLWRRGSWRWAALRSPANLAGAAVGLAAAAYFSARLQPFHVPAGAEITPGRQPMPLVEGDGVSWFAVYLAFVLLEFGLLALALAGSFRRGERAPGERPLLLLTTGTLLALPCAHYGFANDLVMRAGLPALFAVQVLVLRMFADAGGRRRGASWAAAGLLAVGAVNAGLEYGRHVARMARDRSWRDDAARLPVQSLFELQRGVYHRPGFDFARQYLGSTGSFYARWLAPAGRPAPRPVDE